MSSGEDGAGELREGDEPRAAASARRREGTGAMPSTMSSPQRRSQRRKERFTPGRRSVSFEDDPIPSKAFDTATPRPPSAVQEVEESATGPQPPWNPGQERPSTARQHELSQRQREAEAISLPPSRPASAISVAAGHQVEPASLPSATGGGPLQEMAAQPGVGRSAGGTFQLWSQDQPTPSSSGAAMATGQRVRPKTATGVSPLGAQMPGGSEGEVPHGLAARPKTAAARVHRAAAPAPASAAAVVPSVPTTPRDEAAGGEPEGSLSRDGSKKTKLQRKRSLKQLGSRVRMFPGAAAGTTASPNWSAYEGNEDLISLSGLTLPTSAHDDSLAADLLESDDDDSEGEDIVARAEAAAAAAAASRGDSEETDSPFSPSLLQSGQVPGPATGVGVGAVSNAAVGESGSSSTGKDGLFYKANQQDRLEQLHSLAGAFRGEGSDEDTTKLLNEFNASVKDEVLVVGTMSVEALQEEEKKIRAEQIAVEEYTARQHMERQEDLVNLEMTAKKNVYDKMAAKRQDLIDQERYAVTEESEKMAALSRAYDRSEAQLRDVLEKRKAEVSTLYGDLQLADDGQYSGSRQRRWKLEWRRTPQPIEIKLKMLRGVKDKLPAGRYVMLVSLFDRLGGHILRWSNLAGQQWGGVSLPVKHRGRFHDLEIELDQSVHTVCPSRTDVKPGMVLVFELFILRGGVVPTDRVVGWGTFPVCDSEFNIIEGRYKCAMLRGERDPYIDRHSRIEQIMAEDLDSWLCNFYFEIQKLPRYLAGQKEYEVELQFSSAMLGFPDRLRDDVPAVDGNDALVQSQEDIAATLRKGQDDDPALDDSSFDGSKSRTGRKSSMRTRDGTRKRSRFGGLRSRRARRRREQDDDDTVDRPPTSVEFSRRIFEKDENSSSSDEEGDSGIDGFKEEPNERGLYYKIHESVIGEDRDRRVYTMMPKTPLLKQKKKEKANVSKTEELKMHTMSVHPPFSAKAKAEEKAGKKWSYVRRQFFSELGLSQWRSREFWAVLLMFVVVFWIRIYLHYIGQWIFLTGLLIPINKFDFLWISVNLNYQPTLLYTRHELAVVLFGPLTNIFLFALLVLLAYISLKIFNQFPHIVSRFILAFGVMAALDPGFIAIVDVCYGRYVQASGSNPLPIGDAFKLYFHFSRIEGTGVAGIFLVLFCYLFTTCLALALLYVYFLRLHLNGRMMDVYHRLNGKDSDFFTPFDLEVSNEELSWVCRKAEQWRGEEGERRKVAVYDYVWEEAKDSEDEDTSLNGTKGDSRGVRRKAKRNGREVTTHVSIHTLHLDGLRELFRHFLRLPDGAIVEVIGEMGLVGMETRIRTAMQNAGAGRGRTITALPAKRGAIGMDQALFEQRPVLSTQQQSREGLRTRISKREEGDGAYKTTA